MKKKPFFIILMLLLVGNIIISCEKFLPSETSPDSLLDGPVDGLTAEQSQRFLQGDRAFNDEILQLIKGWVPDLSQQVVEVVI